MDYLKLKEFFDERNRCPICDEILEKIPSNVDIKKIKKLYGLRIKKLKALELEYKLINIDSLNYIFELIVDAFYEQIENLYPKIRTTKENSDIYEAIKDNYDTCTKNALVAVKSYIESGKTNKISHNKKFKRGKVV
jgi:hypothetical protein